RRRERDRQARRVWMARRVWRLSRWARACVITSKGRRGAGTRAEKSTCPPPEPHLLFARPGPVLPPGPSASALPFPLPAPSRARPVRPAVRPSPRTAGRDGRARYLVDCPVRLLAGPRWGHQTSAGNCELAWKVDRERPENGYR